MKTQPESVNVPKGIRTATVRDDLRINDAYRRNIHEAQYIKVRVEYAKSTR